MFVDRTRLLVHNKKVTRQQFYGMLTGSVIFDSVETDNRLVLFGKDTTNLSPAQISMTFSAFFAIFLLELILF
jgi:hypothetical protein